MTKPESPSPFAEHWDPLSGLAAALSPPPEPSTPAAAQRYLGKWRGVVVNNVDPLGQGRIQVQVPDVLQFSISTWALPCVPVTGTFMGTYTVPPPLSSVWIEFEQGDPKLPIWVGSFWDDPSERPGLLGNAATKGVPTVAVETQTSGVVVSDVPIPAGAGSGTVVAYAGPSTTVVLNPATASTQAPKVETTGVTEVSISGGRVSITAATEVSISAPKVSISASAVFSVNGTKLTVLGP